MKIYVFCEIFLITLFISINSASYISSPIANDELIIASYLNQNITNSYYKSVLGSLNIPKKEKSTISHPYQEWKNSTDYFEVYKNYIYESFKYAFDKGIEVIDHFVSEIKFIFSNYFNLLSYKFGKLFEVLSLFSPVELVIILSIPFFICIFILWIILSIEYTLARRYQIRRRNSNFIGASTSTNITDLNNHTEIIEESELNDDVFVV
uniref:DUF4126 domain-containing protein n=1 Tax=Parastrongyloides trichosuri TaxID=131310 RepID=A0A0N4ZVB3_PARTI